MEEFEWKHCNGNKSTRITFRSFPFNSHLLYIIKKTAEIDRLKLKISDINEKARLRMRLRSTQAKFDAHRGRYREAMDEMVFMNKQYEEASTNLKKQLVSKGIELLHYKKLEAEKKMQAK